MPDTPQLTPLEEERIRTWGRSLEAPLKLRLLQTADPQADDLARFCNALARLVPALRIVTEDGDPLAAIQVRDNLLVHAVPLGPELEPFLEILDGTALGTLSETHRERLAAMHLPAALRLFIAPDCPFCPAAVRMLAPLALAVPGIRLDVIDGALFPEAAHADQIRSAPTVLLDQGFRWSGVPNLDEVLTALVDRDVTQLGPVSLENMLTDGDAHRLAALMLERGEIFPAFIPLLTHEKWPVRLGAMVALEEIAVRKSALAARVVESLWDFFSSASETLQGDMLYMIGESGGSSCIPRVEEFLSGERSSDLREAAEEALSRLRERSPWISPVSRTG